MDNNEIIITTAGEPNDGSERTSVFAEPNDGAEAASVFGAPTEKTAPDKSESAAEQNIPAAAEQNTPAEAEKPEEHQEESAPETSNSDIMRRAASLWRYRTVAENGTELHTESHCKHTKTGFGEIIGARVRGKKHKHEGTNCDDWFETAVADGCFIAVVADGAGSKQLSRIGARVSCTAATEYLKAALPEMLERDKSLRSKLAGDMKGEEFLGACGDFAAVIGKSASAAFDAVIQELGSLYSDEKYINSLGRNPMLSDLGSTFLAVVAVPVEADGEKQRFVVTLQIGDGCICAVDTKADSASCFRLMGEADSGAFSGETQFLSEKTVSQNAVARKIRISRGVSDILMLMSDGVADDYFPAQPMMKRLTLDLMLNGILPLEGDFSERCEPQPLEFPTAASEQSTPAIQYAKQLIKDDDVNGLWDRRDALAPYSLKAWGGSLGDTAEERLQNWLDNYTERGSFDDRTLVLIKFDD